jgi:hypothetical protein
MASLVHHPVFVSGIVRESFPPGKQSHVRFKNSQEWKNYRPLVPID